MKNSLSDIRPESTFETFQPQNEDSAHIAAGIEELANAVGEKLQKDGRLDRAKLVNLFGEPGRGKSHLLEAFAHRLIALGREGDICLLRTIYSQALSLDIGHQILLVDDLFSSYGSVSDIKKHELELLAKRILLMYESRQLLFVTSNFDWSDLGSRLEEVDPIGRVRSRAQEIGGASVELTGEDYRSIKADVADASDPFGL